MTGGNGLDLEATLLLDLLERHAPAERADRTLGMDATATLAGGAD